MRTLATKQTAINQYNGLGNQLWDLSGQRPTLDLRFAEDRTLVDATTGSNLVDFTRASSGTYVGSDGLIKSATTNLVLQSEDFSTTWTKGANTTITPNYGAAPNGTMTADRVEMVAGSGTFLTQSVSVVSGVTYSFSVYARATSGTAKIALQQGGVNIQVWTISTTWQRLSVQFTAAATGSTTFGFDNDDSATDYILWGAQLEQSTTVGEYIKTTSTINSAPRFDHDPETGESLGLLVEESRTNLLLNSATLATQNVTVTAIAHTLSFYGTGTVTLSGAHSATVVGTGSYPSRATLTFTPTAGTLTVTVSGTVEYANLEIGAGGSGASFPTSYIPTTGSTVTRAADVATDTSTGADIRTLYAQFRSPASGTRPVASLDDNTANERIELFTSGTDPKLLVTDGGGSVADLDAGTITANVTAKLAGRFATDNYAAAINGGTPQTHTAGTLPTVDRLRIGSNQAGDYFNGTIARLTGWNTPLPNSTLQTITQ